MKEYAGYLGAAVALVASLLGIGRFVGRIESRLDQLERAQSYLHGDPSTYLKEMK